MGSNYLALEPAVFGLTYPLPPGLGEQASAIVDAYLKRPEGLAYEVDANGTPIYQTAATPTAVYKLGGALTPGANVSVAVTPTNLTPFIIGEVMILDAGVKSQQEACLVSGFTPPNIITFASVSFAHAAGAGASVGLTITEDRALPAKRSIARVAKWPIANVLSVLGRYAYGRRSDQVGGLYQEMNLLAAVQTFGGPPQWIPIPIGQVDWSGASQTGEVWVPAGLLMAYYSDVRLRYVAGFPSSQAPPDPIVRATAAIAAALQNNQTFGGQMKLLAAATSKQERFFASNVDQDVRAKLAPYMARTQF